MLFNTFQFAIFLALVVACHRSLPRGWRSPMLLGASLIFYACWIPAYLVLLLASLAVNYPLLLGIVRSGHPRLFLAAAIAYTLGLLAFFKYAAMAVETALPVLRSGFGFEPPIPDILLPLGISFYSFQILALAIDAYRGSHAKTPSFGRYALFVSFFPQLIAGPILRGPELLPQLEGGGNPSAELNRRGAWLLVSGLFKKVVMADFLLAPFVDSVFIAPGVGSAPFHWIALYSFAFQIYFDFSGYSDMARGIACLLGFDLPLNFMEPYLSRNPSEFWRRWHMTLSRWLADYLYIPLGGNRRGTSRTYVNLMITMLLGGLWHGASWTFVVWGCLHGLLLVVHRLLSRRAVSTDTPLALRDVPKIFVLFNAVCLIWIFFRAETFDSALVYFSALFGWSSYEGWPILQTAVVVLCMALQILERAVRSHLPEIRASLRMPWGPPAEALVGGIIIGLAVAVAGVGGEFIYFQF